jgi:exodeoxyribonuclease VIII
MNHIMLDLETGGQKPGCIIFSIGAAQFDMKTGEIGKTFYINIDAEDCEKHGLKFDASTVTWWMKQSVEAREALNDCKVSLTVALNSFETWLEEINSRDVQIWANAPSFDCAVLSAAYKAIGSKQPWFYWQERCVRTLTAFNPGIKKTIVNDLAHDALSDCIYQVRYCSEIWNSVINK